jgi:hypothetical protein
MITLYADNQPFFERPAECFDLEQRIMESGQELILESWITNGKPRHSARSRNGLFKPFLDSPISDTRTEAIVRLFLAVMK